MNVETVREALSTVMDPCSLAMGRPMDLVTMGLIDDISVTGDVVKVRLVLTDPMCFYLRGMETAMQDAITSASGGDSVRLELELDGATLWTPERISATAKVPAKTFVKLSRPRA